MRLILLALALLAATPAYAVTCIDPLNKVPPGCTPRGGSTAEKVETSIANVLAKPFQDIADLISSDSDEAIALATSIQDLQDGNGQQCWLGMKAFGQVLKAHPVPVTLKAQSDLEALRLLTMAANKLCANTACTQVFADLTNGINTAAPVGLPVTLPSLNSLCSKVPQVKVVAPITVPATPAPAATPTAPPQ